MKNKKSEFTAWIQVSAAVLVSVFVMLFIFNFDLDFFTRNKIEDKEVNENKIEGGKLGSTLENCISKFGKGIRVAEMKSPDNEVWVMHLFKTESYQIMAFFVDNKLELISYEKPDDLGLSHRDFSYEEILGIVRKHGNPDGWHKQNEFGEDNFKLHNEDSAMTATLVNASDNKFIKKRQLFVTTEKGMSFGEFLDTTSDRINQEMLDEL